MKKSFKLSEEAFQMDGKMPLSQAIPLGLQHVLAMFVGNLTPLLIITGACGLAGGEFAAAAFPAAECHAGSRYCNAGTVVFHRTGGRKGSDYHGYFFRIYRGI